MKEFDRLIKTIRILRSPKGCPWDRAQRLSDYKKYLLEETYELIDGLNENRFTAVEEELGDIFMILLIITEMLKEKGISDASRVLRGANEKLVVRHPHVFGKKHLKTKEEVLKYWIKHKAQQKQRKTIKDRLPRNAPALFLVDLFLKEYEHMKLKARSCRQDKITGLLSEIKMTIALFSQEKNKEELLATSIFLLSKLARMYRFDLEHSVRKRVFKEAAKVAYRTSGETKV
jgi:tetrapyrrole methylase family protein/MazG family protein